MWGAAVLCATAASRCGAGYVYLRTEGHGFPVVRHPDFLQAGARSQVEFDACAMGPGLSSQAKITAQIRKWIHEGRLAVVLDATALRALAVMKLKGKLPASWILTPHEGELAGLMGVSSKTVRANRLHWAMMVQKKFGCVILLKGHQTLVVDSEGAYQIKSGNVALAKAGTGDVLTGMVLAFRSQGLDASTAACLAAYVHGSIADRWVKDGKSVLSLMASDLGEKLPKFLSQLRG